MSNAADNTHTGQPAQDVPWFDLDDPAYRERANALSNQPDIASAAAEYREKGYLIRDFGLPEADLEAAADYTRNIKTFRVQDAWMVNDAVKRLATNPKITAFLSELYQREAFPFQTLNFPRGSQQGTHADTYFFNSIPAGFMCGVWIALEDIHPDSGPLAYYPGSHRIRAVVSNADLPGGVSGAYAGHIADTAEKSGAALETAPIRRGQAFIWASNLYHGGSPIADPARTRLSQVSHYYFRGCSYFTPYASEEGQTFWREPYDIGSGRFVSNAEAGHRPRLSHRIGQRLRIWTRRPFAS